MVRRLHLYVIALLMMAPLTVLGESGAEGWLRYSRITNPAALRSYRSVPRQVVQAGTSAPSRNAANELVRGLRSMLGAEIG